MGTAKCQFDAQAEEVAEQAIATICNFYPGVNVVRETSNIAVLTDEAQTADMLSRIFRSTIATELLNARGKAAREDIWDLLLR